MHHALVCLFPLLAAASDTPEPAPPGPPVPPAAEPPETGPGAPPPGAPDAPVGASPSDLPVAGAAIRNMLREVGFGDVRGEVTGPPVPTAGPGTPMNPSAVHREIPPPSGSAAPGFLLQFRVQQQGSEPIRVEVGSVLFRPNDAGQPPDELGGDGLWSTMIERYPSGAPVVVSQGNVELARAEIQLRETDDIPVMVLEIP